ncbi:CBS domain-containing protein [Alkalihalobacillus sp. MEB130]|uniref:CBS domain-containing protein n=1 Tax=Alkalihalobacillus sp. MEB130 TaxID=2976704 RepID=UPI0028DF2F0E|nr:CBS domain-containing protein [Alkalihalobacillus sp. MEB130]MDT8861565.1 CBS domain-containing protein [Alkalihalobacillus sp. MEB130]
MFIRNCLTPLKELVLLKPKMTIREALDVFGQSHYSLPVISEDGSSFLGILSKRSILEYYESKPAQTSLEELHKDPIDHCIEKTTSNEFVDLRKGHFEDCLPIIVRYPFVPVLDGDQFVGIIKRSIVEQTLESCFGTNVKGIRILLGVHNQVGTLLGVSKIITKYNVNIISDIGFEADSNYLRRLLIKIEETPNLAKILHDLNKHGYRVLEVE